MLPLIHNPFLWAVTYFLLRDIGYLQSVTCYLPSVTCYTFLAICPLLSFNMLPATFHLLSVASIFYLLPATLNTCYSISQICNIAGNITCCLLPVSCYSLSAFCYYVFPATCHICYHLPATCCLAILASLLGFVLLSVLKVVVFVVHVTTATWAYNQSSSRHPYRGCPRRSG